MHLISKKKQRSTDKIKVDQKTVTLSQLARDVKSARRKFWALVVSMALVTSMIVPYLSLAATVADDDSTVFTGEVIPGYSMGGVKIAAYGVDLNDWGRVQNETVVQTNYGIWSGERSKKANEHLRDESISSFVELGDDDAAKSYNLDVTDRSQGWSAMTGKTNYSLNHPDGTDNSSQSNQYVNVAPYRTVADYNYWDSKQPTPSDNATADIEVSLFADFIAIGMAGTGQDNLYPVVLQSPDDANVNNKGITYNSAVGIVPYYVSLKKLMDAYSLDDPRSGQGASMSSLLEAIRKDPNPFRQAALDSNLLNLKHDNATYRCYNNPNTKQSSSTTAFNPYPYSMVFTTTEGASQIVSSVYENAEAYVYFSPASAYSQYLALKSEYEEFLTAHSAQVATNEPEIVFRSGYYLANMAILEAYLSEALPQDMTRGYVGPSEPRSIYGDEAGQGVSVSVPGSTNADTCENPETYKSVSYSSIMYDVAKNVVTKTSATGVNIQLASTNAIMDTLSVFGYALGRTDLKPGVMQGMTVADNFNRVNAFTPYDENAQANKEPTEETTNAAGMYIAPYHPIQAHRMPSSEKTYRFPIVSSVPYQAIIEYIKAFGFSNTRTHLSYDSLALEAIDTSAESEFKLTNDDKAASLAGALSALDADVSGKYLVDAQTQLQNRSIALNGSGTGFTQAELSGDGVAESTTTAARMDNALLNFQASAMTADNVHDLVDVVRSTQGLKYETWNRFYNPCKSAGQDNDLFLTRVSPAVTTYMPSILVNGYTPAGGSQVDVSLTPVNCSFDYFSIPSFGPCFASHSSTDCYYGALNYELKAFYSREFTSSLADNVGIPAVEYYEKTKQAIVNNPSLEGVTIKAELADFYVLAKRLAFLTATVSMRDDNAYSGQRLGEAYGDGTYYTDPATFKTPDEFEFKSTGGGADSVVILPTDNDDVSEDGVAKENIVVLPPVELTAVKKKYYEDDSSSVSRLLDLMRKNAVKWTSGETPWTDKKTDYHDELTFGFIIPIYKDTVFLEDHLADPIKDKPEKERGENYDKLFAIKYQAALNSLLNEGGEFYWIDKKELKKQVGNKTLKPNLTKEYGEYVDPVESYYHGVAFDGGVEGFEGVTFNSRADITAAYRELIAKATSKVTSSVNDMIKDRQTVDQLPTQIQNCLGWATDQRSSVSEQSYATDPSDAVISVDLNTANEVPHVEGNIFSASSLARYYCKFDPESMKIMPAWDVTSATSMTARAVRGVEGATYLATIQPACYSISATVQRSTLMVGTGGVSYPYSGLVTGRMASGTSQYATLEGHNIDYASLENGVSGDLSVKQRARIVKITNQNYAGVADFVSIVSNTGAFFGEMGSSMLSTSSNMFKTAFFQSNQAANSSGSTTVIASEATRWDSAANYVFNWETGKMERVDASLLGASASGGAASANAATMRNWANNILLGQGYAFYALLQEIGLMIVMISLLFIAFRNFYAYALSDSKGANIITAQTQLKVVLPRAIIAIFMIGLPPLGAGSTGFQGGAFLLCQFLGTIVAYVSDIFASLDGAGIMGLWQFGQSALGNDIFSFFAFMVAAAVISAMFLVGAVCVIIQILCLAAFYLTGPIVWALFVWPYGYDASAPRSGTLAKNDNFVAKTTKKLSLGPLTGGRIGNAAPSGWIVGYCSVACLSIAWSLLFWIVSMLFAGSSGLGTAASMPGSIAAPTSSSQYASASASLIDSGLFGSGAGSSMFGLVFLTVVAVIVFALMLWFMKKVLVGTVISTVEVSQTFGSGVVKGSRNSTAARGNDSSVPGEGAAGAQDAAGRIPREEPHKSMRELQDAQARRAQLSEKQRNRQGFAPGSPNPAEVPNVLDSAAIAADVSRRAQDLSSYNVRMLDGVQEALDMVNEMEGRPLAERSRMLATASPAARKALKDSELLVGNALAHDAIDSGAAAKALEERSHAISKMIEQKRALAVGEQATLDASDRRELRDETVPATVRSLAPEVNVIAEAAGTSSQMLSSTEYMGKSQETSEKVLEAQERFEQVSEKARELESVMENTEKLLAENNMVHASSLNSLKELESQTREQIKSLASSTEIEKIGTVGEDGKLNVLGSVDAIGNLRIESVAAVGALAATIADGFFELYKADGQDDAAAFAHATAQVAKVLAPVNELAAKQYPKASIAAAGSGVNAVMAAKALRAMREARKPEAMSNSVFLMNVLQASGTMDAVAPSDTSKRKALCEVRPETRNHDLVKSQKVLGLAREMLDIAVNATSSEAVSAFNETVFSLLKPESQESTSMLQLKDELDKQGTINNAVGMLFAPDFAPKHPDVSEQQLGELLAALQGFYATEDMLLDRGIRNAMNEIWEKYGIDVEYVLTNLRDAMGVAQFVVPAFMVDAQDPSNKVAVDLVSRGLMVSDFSYMVLKEAARPMPLAEAGERVAELVEKRFQDFDLECQREGLDGGAEEFVRERADIDSVLSVLNAERLNATSDNIGKVLAREREFVNIEEQKAAVGDFEQKRQKLDMLSTQAHMDALRYHTFPELILNELSAVAKSGFKGILGETRALGAAESPESDAGGEKAAPKTLEPVSLREKEQVGIFSRYLVDASDTPEHKLVSDLVVQCAELRENKAQTGAFEKLVSDKLVEYRDSLNAECRARRITGYKALLDFGRAFDMLQEDARKVLESPDATLEEPEFLDRYMEHRATRRHLDAEATAAETKAILLQVQAYKEVFTAENRAKVNVIASPQEDIGILKDIFTGKAEAGDAANLSPTKELAELEEDSASE